MEFELKNFEEKINDITEQFMSLLDSNNVVEDSITAKFDSIAKSPIGEVGFSDAIGVGDTTGNIPSHAIKFEGTDDLNKRLEDLYNSRKVDSIKEKAAPVMTFADYGIGGFSSNVPAFGSDTNDKIHIANEKEAINMANNGYTIDDDNSIFSFATIPQDRALATKRSFSDVLFMDIPWDTKLDVWGGVKSFMNTQVKITF
ncbi:MAG: hypothetical protein IKI57_04990 [Clostridia bacterium]|nr:hypothetical protein [Clostridia bacterium]